MERLDEARHLVDIPKEQPEQATTKPNPDTNINELSSSPRTVNLFPQLPHIEEAAAAKIEKTFRGYRTRKALSQMKIGVKERSVILSEMKRVNRLIERSSSAQVFNRKPMEEILQTAEIIGKHQSKKPVEAFKGFVDDRVGNCGDSAKLLYMFLTHNEALSPELRAQVKLIKLDYPDDHTLVMIGRLNDPDSLVVDPWIRYLDLPKRRGFRAKPVLASSENRERGFFGSKRDYKKFLSNHEDGNFLQFDGSHRMVSREFPYSKNEQQEILNYVRKLNGVD